MLLANPTKAKLKLGWESKVKFKELVKIMCEHDIKLAEKETRLARKTKIINEIKKVLGENGEDSEVGDYR